MVSDKKSTNKGSIELSKRYIKTLPNGTNMEVDISVELNNYDVSDFHDIGSKIGICSRSFYHEFLEHVKNTP